MIVNGNSNTDIRDWQEVRVLGYKVEISTKKWKRFWNQSSHFWRVSQQIATPSKAKLRHHGDSYSKI